MAEPNELEAWREVHSKLLIACELAQEAVDAERMQYRYWMEEIVANVTEEGQYTSTSGWTRPSAPKKTISKKKLALLYKKRPRGKKSESSTASKNKKKKRKVSSTSVTRAEEEPPRKLRINMKKQKVTAATTAVAPWTPVTSFPTPAAPRQYQEDDEDHDEVDDEDSHDSHMPEDEDEEEDDDDQNVRDDTVDEEEEEDDDDDDSTSRPHYEQPNEYGAQAPYMGQNPLQMMVCVPLFVDTKLFYECRIFSQRFSICFVKFIFFFLLACHITGSRGVWVVSSGLRE